MSKPVEMGIGLTIGVPTLGRPVPIQWAWAFKCMTPPINFNTVHAQVYGKAIAEARNMIAEDAVKNGSRYLFFVGDDVVCPPHTLKQLIFRMEHDKTLGIVGGIYCSKSTPPAPLVFRGNGNGSFWDWKIGEYFDVTALGMDCTLIRTDIFKELKPPWFVTVDQDEFLEARNAAEQWTEDIYFCKRVCEETKYKIFADATVMCEHWDVYTKTPYTLPANSLPMKRKELTSGAKKVVDLGCGETNRQEQYPDCELIRVDLRNECNPDYRCDLRQLPFGDKSVDIVFSSHVLEHFDRWEAEDCLKEWLRILKEDGELHFILPNIAWAAEQIMKGMVDINVLNVLYGAQSNPYDYHKCGYTPSTLQKVLEDKGMEMISCELQGYNIIMKAKFLERVKVLDI